MVSTFRPYTLSTQTPEKREILLITTPSNSGSKPTNPRGAKVVAEVTQLARHENLRLEKFTIDYESNLTTEIRSHLHRLGIDKTRVIVAAGDGSAALILAALRTTGVETLIVPGGTINLLAKHLNTELPSAWATFMRGEGKMRSVFGRELEISDNNGEIITTAPWFSFTCVGLGAHFLEAYEGLSRTHPAWFNVLRASAGLAPQVVGSREKFADFSAIANPLYGPSMDLGFQNDYLSNHNFGVMQLGPEPGFSAAWKFIALQALMHDPIRNWYWGDKMPQFLDHVTLHRDLRNLAKGFEPKMTTNSQHELTFQVQSGQTVYWHTDGSPGHNTFTKPGTVKVRRSTSPGVVSLFCA